MNIVVTGAAGFIGRHTVARLLADGHDVVGIDRRPPEQPLPHETVVRCDLLSGRPEIPTALSQADAVVHLAGYPGVRDRGPVADAARWRDNVVAGAFVCERTPPGTPLIVASSSSVYGGAGLAGGWNPRPCHEDRALRPRGAYARSKVALEHRCRERARRGGHVAVVRPFTVAGEGQRPDMALATWIAQSRAGRPMTVLGSPTRRRDVTDVRDVVRAIRRLLETGHATTVNVGTGRTFTLHELTTTVARQLAVPHRTIVREADPVEPPVTRADTRRCRALLGFVPRTDLSELVRRQLATTDPSTHEVAA